MFGPPLTSKDRPVDPMDRTPGDATPRRRRASTPSPTSQPTDLHETAEGETSPDSDLETRSPKRPSSARPPRPEQIAAADSSSDGPTRDLPARSGAKRSRTEARAKRVLRPSRGQRLMDSAGPDPATPVERVRLAIGALVGVHGLDGEVKLRLFTDDPEHLATLKRVYVGDESQPRRLLGVRFHAGQALLRLEGVASPEEGMALRGRTLRIVGTDARPLEPGEYFLYQLIGLQVVDEEGSSLGRVTDLMETGAHDVFVVTPSNGPDQLFPNHPEVVLDIDPAHGRIIVRPLVYDE